MNGSARTRVFAVLGRPVAHSLSPRMHNAAFRAMGLDAVYVALQPDDSNLAGLMVTLARTGGGGNVTIPFKGAAAAIDASWDDRVKRLQVANVFGLVDGALHVANTDVDGILAGVDALPGAAARWGVLGTGGSARAVAGAALERGVSIGVRSRDPARGAAFAEWSAALGIRDVPFDECDLVINATPLGLGSGDALPIDPTHLGAGTMALDLAYAHDGATAWVRACRARGLAAVDGREVLLAQGAASWRTWFGAVAPPLELMRAALDGQVG